MFGFVKQIFNFSNDFFFGFNLSSVNPLKVFQWTMKNVK